MTTEEPTTGLPKLTFNLHEVEKMTGFSFDKLFKLCASDEVEYTELPRSRNGKGSTMAMTMAQVHALLQRQTRPARGEGASPAQGQARVRVPAGCQPPARRNKGALRRSA